MSKKVYNLVVAIVGGLSTIAIGVVTFLTLLMQWPSTLQSELVQQQ